MVITILCKDIISEDLSAFKEQIGTYSFFNDLSDDMAKLTQHILLSKYGNSNIRYETALNFLNALSLRVYDIAPIYEKRFNIFKEAIEEANNMFIYSTRQENETHDIDTTYEQNEVQKNADTPTGIKSSTDFVDRYTNNMSHNVGSGSTTDDRTITKNETNSAELLARLDDLQKLRSQALEEYTNRFADLFIQFM